MTVYLGDDNGLRGFYIVFSAQDLSSLDCIDWASLIMFIFQKNENIYILDL